MPTTHEKKALFSQLLSATPDQILIETIEDIHPVDLLDYFYEDKEDAKQLFMRLPAEIIGAIIDEAEDEDKLEILQLFEGKTRQDVLQEIASDELVDLIGTLDDDAAAKMIAELPSDEGAEIQTLLQYDSETAGGIMATEYIAIHESESVTSVLQGLQISAPDAESIYYLFVVNQQNELTGVVSLRDLVVHPFETSIGDIVNPNVYSVRYDLDQEEVARKFQKYGFLALPVVDEANQLLGIITVDDIMEIMEDETTEDIHHLGGVDAEERVDGTLFEAVKSRTPWLFINLVTAILASATVALFDEAIAQVVILATFMPIIAGMGGNAGTQTLTLVVRGIALGELTGDNARRILWKEIGAGFITGAATGLGIAILGMLYSGKPIFGLIIFIAMILNMTLATFAGYVVPVVLKKFNIDPALASAIFVTTVTDVLGFFFFLGLGSLFIQYLI